LANGIQNIIREIESWGIEPDGKQAKTVFQIDVGEYGYGDKFCGTRVPILRKIAKKYCGVSLDDVANLLQNELHEGRFVAFVLLLEKFRSQPGEAPEIHLKNIRFIDNWDLVDVAAYKICGTDCLNRSNTDIIWELAKSKNLWENRIAIVSSFAFIRNHQLQLTVDLCEHFLNHGHHLIHKACGWILREVEKRNTNLLLGFVNSHKLPGIMKSYALEIIRQTTKKF
jgi:3-methyladenine DNA glycosylase AlkD